MNKVKIAVVVGLVIGSIGCSSPPPTPAQDEDYDAKYVYNVDHMPDLDRQLLIRDKLKATVCEGEKVKTFSVNRKWGMIKCNDGSYMRFDTNKVKVDY